MTIPLDKGSTQNCSVVTKTLKHWGYALSNTAMSKPGVWWLLASPVLSGPLTFIGKTGQRGSRKLCTNTPGLQIHTPRGQNARNTRFEHHDMQKWGGAGRCCAPALDAVLLRRPRLEQPWRRSSWTPGRRFFASG